MKSTFFLACLVFLSGACGSVSAGHHNHRRHHARSSSVSAAAKLNDPSSGTPTSDFAASANLPAAKLAAAAKKAKKAGQKYQISQGSKTSSTIFTDWADFKNVSLSHATAALSCLIKVFINVGFCLRVDGRYGYRL
jgi:hypothetical protein